MLEVRNALSVKKQIRQQLAVEKKHKDFLSNKTGSNVPPFTLARWLLQHWESKNHEEIRYLSLLYSQRFGKKQLWEVHRIFWKFSSRKVSQDYDQITKQTVFNRSGENYTGTSLIRPFLGLKKCILSSMVPSISIGNYFSYMILF